MDKQHMKAQVSMEFMIISGISLFIFVIILGLLSGNLISIGNRRTEIMAEDIVIMVQKEINLASRVLDGYYREFYIPQKLGNKNYTIALFSNEVFASTGKDDFWRPIPDVIGNVNKGLNIITKSNGIVYLN